MNGAAEDLYQALILERARSPRHAGKPAAWDAEAEGDNPTCGDRIHLYVSHDGMRVSHDSRGCAIMAASADLMAEAVQNLSPAEIAQRSTAFEAVLNTGSADPSLGDLNALKGVAAFRSRIRCATLPWRALAEALQQDAHHG